MKNPQSFSLSQARQGDIEVINILLNKSLNPKGISVKCRILDCCLQIILESEETLNASKMTKFLKYGFEKLGVEGIESLQIYGKRSEEDFPDWHENIKLFADEPDSQKVLSDSLVLSENQSDNGQIIALPETRRIEGNKLSNHLYISLRITCCQHLSYKVDSENDDKTIHEIVENFVDGLESGLRQDLDQFAKDFSDIAKSHKIQIDALKIQAIISDLIYSGFTGVRLSIRDLERVTREVLKTEFPQENNALKAFFMGAAQEFSANLIGRTIMSQEALIGSFVGTLIVPGIGSVIGGAVGGWLGGSRRQKALEQLIQSYQESRLKVWQQWDSLICILYTKISDEICNENSLHLLDYKLLVQSFDFFNQGNNYINSNPQKAIEFYDKAIQINPELVAAWNNKGYALNQLEKFEEAVSALNYVIQLDSTWITAFSNLGDSLQGLGKSEDAIKAYAEVLKLDDKDYGVWFNTAACFYDLQDFDKAIEIGNKLIELNSENLLGWYVKATCQLELGHIQEALKYSEEAYRRNADVFQELVKNDSDFDTLRDYERFQVLIESSFWINYTQLKKCLEKQQWREADRETARIMKTLAQKITNSTEINKDTISLFPCVDLNTIDFLWNKHSNRRFGFSIQRDIYQSSSQNRDVFGSKIGWRIKDVDGNYSWRSNSSFDYNSKTMPIGHLPSSLWAGEDAIWVENRRDRLIALFARMDSCTRHSAG